jgi:iron only hydrogenase large subunit-like protein
MNRSVIYTEKNNCVDCYRCIRECPVKAIKIEDNSASVIEDMCIYCGKCLGACPAKAKHYRADLPSVKLALKQGRKMIVSLAPSWVSSFGNVEKSAIYKALHQLGFSVVEETAVGAELVTRFSADYVLNSTNKIHISSCCPVVVNLIVKYHPQLASSIIPVVSPVEAHARLLRKEHGAQAFIVFIGPCVAKKQEMMDHPSAIDAALTYTELLEWLEEKCIDLESCGSDSKMEAAGELEAAPLLYPIEGGMVTGINQELGEAKVKTYSFSGMKSVKAIIEELDESNVSEKIFLELLACNGGCINGPAVISKTPLLHKLKIEKYAQRGKTQSQISPEQKMAWEELSEPYSLSPVIHCVYPEDEIAEIMHGLGKYSKKDELNCAGCGYDNCREFAQALLDGKANRIMCVSYMRKVAQDKASVLLQKMPYGVVMVDERFHVVDCNHKFAEAAGTAFNAIFESEGGIQGTDIRPYISFEKFFDAIFLGEAELIEHDLREGDKFYHITIVSILQYRLACAIVRDLSEPEVQHELMTGRIHEVIKQNLEAVQRIAYLLGENSSFTESMLNSILESQDQKKPLNFDNELIAH